uniref:Uncharacterized protein n=1 Tax=Terrapene triunguis TaxID=2587831 RepID=A0A674JK23_9SAUR
MSHQCDSVAKKPAIILGHIKRSAGCKPQKAIVPLYSALGRPQLKYYPKVIGGAKKILGFSPIIIGRHVRNICLVYMEDTSRKN